mmetsp:Transcript_10146/g.33188  ORF Transcript_10146/g.33188 Transcript_10146/m.33188 type:complete len:207 (-) Transcript_10146:1603-2223(-)
MMLAGDHLDQQQQQQQRGGPRYDHLAGRKRSYEEEMMRPKYADHHGHHGLSLVNLSGTWRLDKLRSESLTPYLQAMGLCQIAIDGHQQKEASTETYYTFEQSPVSFVTTKLGWSGSSRREVFFGRPQMEPSQSGQIPRQTMAAIHGDSVVVTTEMDKKTLVDIKTLTNGSIKCVIQLLAPQAKIQVVRWLVPSEPLGSIEPSDDEA